MVIAALLALTCKALKFQLPGLLYNGVTSIAGVTTTISFVSLGVSLDLGELRSNRRPLILGVALRMIVVPVVFLPIVVALGFRGPALCAMMILFAAPAGVARFTLWPWLWERTASLLASWCAAPRSCLFLRCLFLRLHFG